MNPSAKEENIRVWSPDMLRALGRLDLVADVVTDSVTQGMHRSVRRGFSSEFFDYKSYQEGDDASKIDWRLFARTNKFYLKRFEAETSLEVMILCDFSASMRWQWKKSASKLEFAVWLAASAAWLFTQRRDLVGFHSFGDNETRHVAPKSSARHAEEIFSVLTKKSNPDPRREQETFLQAANALRSIQPHRGMILVFSDFEMPEDELHEQIPLLFAGRDDVAVFHLLDRFEAHPPFEQLTHIRDSETGDILPVSLADIKTEHPRRVEAFRNTVRRIVEHHGGRYLAADTGMPPADILLRFMRGKERLP